MDRTRLVVLAMAASVIAFGGAIPAAVSERAHQAQAPPDETLELVNVEIDRSGMLFADKWQVSETSASLDTDQYSHEHSWTIPSTIPPGGANATLNVSATDKSGGRISANTALFGGVDIDGSTNGVEAVAHADKNAGQPTDSDTKTVELTPRGGGPVSMTVRIQDGPSIRFDYKIVKTPPPPITPRSEPPEVGALTSYAAPRPLRPVALPFPVLGAGVRSAKTDVELERSKGRSINDADFIAAAQPSEQNVVKALRVCLMLVSPKLGEFIDDLSDEEKDAFGRCAQVVSRVLQRAEQLRAQGNDASSARPAARRCRAVTVPLRGTHTRSPLAVTCTRTAAGMRITVRPRKSGRSLRSAAGRAPKLIVGRSRRAATRRGDRVNVLWRTKTG